MKSLKNTVTLIRKSTRAMVRELGLFSTDSLFEIPLMMRHILVELEIHGTLSHIELAAILKLEKSTISRIIKKMLAMKAISIVVHHEDQRFKHVLLTETGQKILERVNSTANQQVSDALENLTVEEHQCVIAGLELYTQSLKLARIKKEYRVRLIQKKDNIAMMLLIKEVLKEHQADRPGTAFNDLELTNLFKAYSPKNTAYFVLERVADQQVVGGVGYGPLLGGEKSICELKKMYLSQQCRGLGLGKLLLQAVLNAAKNDEYKKCYLETLANMHAAKLLYEKMGFQYLDKPLGDTGHHTCDIWMSKKL